MILRLMASLTLLGATMSAWAAAPIVPWSKQQKANLAERDRLSKLGPRLWQEKEYDEALAMAKRIAELEREVLGETHPETMASLVRLARLRELLGRFADAARTRKELLRLQEKRFGEGHWEATDARIALQDVDRLSKLTPEQRGQLYLAEVWTARVVQLLGQGKAKDALPLAVKSVEVRGQLLGKKHRLYATSLNNLAALYSDAGEPAKALPLYEEVREVYEQALGKRHPHYAAGLNNLALLHLNMGEATKALPLFEEARRVTQAARGKSHPDYATSLNNLAKLHHDRDEIARSLQLYKEAREVYAQVRGNNHPDYAAGTNNLAELYFDLGEYDKASSLYEEAREVYEQTVGKKHAGYATVLSNQARLHLRKGERTKALRLHQEALRLREQTVGKTHPSYANSLNSLALMYADAGETAKALTLYREALQLVGQTRGKTHPHYANVLNNLAALHRDVGDGTKALALYQEARDVYEQTLGKRHAHYALSLNNLAGLYRDVGKTKEAVEWSSLALQAYEAHLEGADHLGERQRDLALQQVLHGLGVLLSFQEHAEVSAAKRYSAVLSWKGRVAARSALERMALERPELSETVDELKAARARLARLALQTPPPAQRPAWLKQVAALAEKKEDLEAELARRSAEFRDRNRLLALTPEQLAKQLPDGVVFVDLLEHGYSFGPKDERWKKAEGEPRLAAFVTRPGKEVVLVPLGAADPVTAAVGRWRAAIERPPTDATRSATAEAAAVLRERVWDKIAKHLGDAKTVVVAPDGALTQFPFAALPGSTKGTYLIEEVALAHVASGAQLFGLLQPAAKDAKLGKGLVAVGGIDYGKGSPYTLLAGTGPEARRCKESYEKAFGGGATLLEGQEVTPVGLRKALAKRPCYLHLATHGYFEPAGRVERLLEGLAGRDGGFVLWKQQKDTFARLPGLRCGLALTGANRVPSADDPEALPNVLTGDELAHLDLRGCEVAVLSACQTALGDVTRSQGVVGLQRSLHTAGVRTTVTSLWCVQDAATAELMDEFYKNLWGERKMTRLEALRQAQLSILRDPERVRKRTDALLADARKRGLSETQMRGIKGRLATDLPEGGKVEDKPKTSPEAWWAAFVLCGDWR